MRDWWQHDYVIKPYRVMVYTDAYFGGHRIIHTLVCLTDKPATGLFRLQVRGLSGIGIKKVICVYVCVCVCVCARVCACVWWKGVMVLTSSAELANFPLPHTTTPWLFPYCINIYDQTAAEQYSFSPNKFNVSQTKKKTIKSFKYWNSMPGPWLTVSRRNGEPSANRIRAMKNNANFNTK